MGVMRILIVGCGEFFPPKEIGLMTTLSNKQKKKWADAVRVLGYIIWLDLCLVLRAGIQHVMAKSRYRIGVSRLCRRKQKDIFRVGMRGVRLGLRRGGIRDIIWGRGMLLVGLLI